MTNTDLGNLLKAVIAKQLSAPDAVRRLVAAGHHRAEAEELVFFALGGSDIVEIMPDGRRRYSSGRYADEIDADMKR